MFTGIIETLGSIVSLHKGDDNVEVTATVETLTTVLAEMMEMAAVRTKRVSPDPVKGSPMPAASTRPCQNVDV